jgi:2-polyprenyl-3-methyl-5-hydroxy-6-metoxy-1,4-benzoquinol methylase
MKPVERIYIDNVELERLEKDILVRRHIERYAMIRQWCYGNVLDFACGCGYGSKIISKNPDVKKVYAIDINKEAISWANKYHYSDNVIFIDKNLTEFEEKIDLLVCLETIEHIKDKDFLPKQVERIGINHLFISFPSKKTTHYNPFHFYDFTTKEVLDLFPSFGLLDEIYLNKEVKVLNLKR